MWTVGRIAAGLMLAALTLSLACDDGPRQVPEEELNLLRIRPDAPPLETMDTSFYAVVGESRQLTIYHAASASGPRTIFFAINLAATSLLSDPNGNPIAPGDSALIRVRVPDPTRVLVDLQPNGLQFNPAAPAQILLHYDQVDPDFNGDGEVNNDDDSLEQQFRIFRQETSGALFLELSSTVNEDLRGVGASITGFTRYVVAY